MKYQNLAGNLNRKVCAAHYGWQQAPIWESDQRSGEPSIVHLTYSAILAVIGEAEVEWAAVDASDVQDRDRMTFTLTVWTSGLVVQAVRKPEELRPTVAVQPRVALDRLQVLKAPLLTVSDWGFNEAAVELQLGYPAFKATLRDPRGDDLLAGMARFVADLQA